MFSAWQSEVDKFYTKAVFSFLSYSKSLSYFLSGWYIIPSGASKATWLYKVLNLFHVYKIVWNFPSLTVFPTLFFVTTIGWTVFNIQMHWYFLHRHFKKCFKPYSTTFSSCKSHRKKKLQNSQHEHVFFIWSLEGVALYHENSIIRNIQMILNKW